MNGALLLLALPLAAADLGGHADPKTGFVAPALVDERKTILEEMWQRRLLAPDQSAWAPRDFELLQKIRRAEKDARAYFRRRSGGERPWTSQPSSGAGPARLTKEGYERYVSLLSQDAIAFFESKGVEASRVFRLRDLDDRPMFDGRGWITEAGIRVYDRARLNLEIFWKDIGGEVYGTRRPPTRQFNKPSQ